MKGEKKQGCKRDLIKKVKGRESLKR